MSGSGDRAEWYSTRWSRLKTLNWETFIQDNDNKYRIRTDIQWYTYLFSLKQVWLYYGSGTVVHMSRAGRAAGGRCCITRVDIVAAILKVWCNIKIWLFHRCFCLFTYCQISFLFDLKWWSFRLLLITSPLQYQTRRRRTTKWVAIWDQFSIQKLWVFSLFGSMAFGSLIGQLLSLQLRSH